MESGIVSTQGKKLLFIGFLMVLVVWLVGGEDDPGLLPQISAQQDARGTHAQAAAQPPEVRNEPANAGHSVLTDESPELDAWYARAGSNGPIDPTPQTDDFLVNDTEPVLSTEPTR